MVFLTLNEVRRTGQKRTSFQTREGENGKLVVLTYPDSMYDLADDRRERNLTKHIRGKLAWEAELARRPLKEN